MIITKEKEITYFPSFIKYFEITLNDTNNNSAISIGIISNPDKLKKERIIGNDERIVRWNKRPIRQKE